jgi:hypothetical protein
MSRSYLLGIVKTYQQSPEALRNYDDPGAPFLSDRVLCRNLLQAGADLCA